MNTLTSELLSQIALFLPNLTDVINLFQTNKYAAQCCTNDYFWMQRFYKDYPKLTGLNLSIAIGFNLENRSYKDLYRFIYSTNIGENFTTCTCTCRGNGICLTTCQCNGSKDCSSNGLCSCSDPHFPIRFIKPEPPFRIFDMKRIPLTQIGCKSNYSIGPDIALYKLRNSNNLWQFSVHKSDNDKFNTLNGCYLDETTEVIRKYIVELLSEGYIRLDQSDISRRKYNELNKKCSTPVIYEHYHVETY